MVLAISAEREIQQQHIIIATTTTIITPTSEHSSLKKTTLKLNTVIKNPQNPAVTQITLISFKMYLWMAIMIKLASLWAKQLN